MAKAEPTSSPAPDAPPAKKRRLWRRLGYVFLGLVALLVIARAIMPSYVRWYVNSTIDKSPLYDGSIGSVEIRLLRGGYTIHNINLDKTTGNVPVPFFSARRVDLNLQWDALLSGRVVGRVVIESPEINFVDAKDSASSQSGGGGPWLQMIRDLFPFQINSAEVHNGAIHFRAFDADPPVDVYMSQIEASVENLGNIHNEITPLITTVEASALAMDQAKFELKLKMDPFSYRPTFQLAARLMGLDVTQLNSLTQAYGSFDFQRGLFDLVLEINSREGDLEGYIKPLFRNVQVFNLKKDIAKDDPLTFLWESLVGATSEILKNRPRDQLGTLIPLTGQISDPGSDILVTIGNILRNAFVRAYLPQFEGETPAVDGLKFGPGTTYNPVTQDQP